MDLAAYLGSVAGMCTLGVGAIYAVVHTFGARIDDVGRRFDTRFDDLGPRFDGLDRRIDNLRTDFDGRFGRLERQNDVPIDAVADLGHRVTRLEGGSSH